MPTDQSVVAVSGQGIAAKAIAVAATAAGKAYVWGGKSTDGFDCSGFVSYVFVALFPNASASYQMSVAGYISSELFDNVAEVDKKLGDIVIFPKTGSFPNHIGIVLDADTWIGSQSSTGTKDVKFSNPFWGARSRNFRRVRGLSPVAMNGGRGVLEASIGFA